MNGAPGILIAALTLATSALADTTEFCIEGSFDLGARLQGWRPEKGEWSPASWCIITEDESDRVLFRATGKSNPDMQSNWTVAFLPPDLVRIVNRGSPPDVEFIAAESTADAARHRRIDPRRLVAELDRHPEWIAGNQSGAMIVGYPESGVTALVRLTGKRLVRVEATADMPLLGRVPVAWIWDWSEAGHPVLELSVDEVPMFRGRGSWRELTADEAGVVWASTPGADPVEVPGTNWPSRINMQLVELGDGAFLVQGVRSGFHHLVVDTEDGLVVADAPAGWVEIQQIPAFDLVPGMGISGLSERFIDFLAESFPDRPLFAVALTHAHDDHVGGARAFAAAGARVYAPAEITDFLGEALNHAHMPADRMQADRRVDLIAVDEPVTIGDRVILVPMGESPHVQASLGVQDIDTGVFFVSDLHVPNSDSAEPRADRLATECWFAEWATRNLAPDVIVLNSHSTIRTPVERLQRTREFASCKTLTPPEPPPSATS